MDPIVLEHLQHLALAGPRFLLRHPFGNVLLIELRAVEGYSEDNWHPSDLGHEIIARGFVDWFAREVEPPTATEAVPGEADPEP